MWKFLPKRGNSNTSERIELIERFIALFGIEKIQCLTADREFIGDDWFAYLKKKDIPFFGYPLKTGQLVSSKGYQ
jgi:hypothetical protein